MVEEPARAVAPANDDTDDASSSDFNSGSNEAASTPNTAAALKKKIDSSNSKIRLTNRERKDLKRAQNEQQPSHKVASASSDSDGSSKLFVIFAVSLFLIVAITALVMVFSRGFVHSIFFTFVLVHSTVFH